MPNCITEHAQYLNEELQNLPISFSIAKPTKILDKITKKI